MAAELAVRNIEELEALLTSDDPGSIPEVVEDPEQISREIVQQLLGATSEDEVFNIGGATPWRELLGVPVAVESFNWRPSTFEEGSSIFFVVRGYRLDEGEPVILTTGARTVLAQIVALYRLGKLGRDCVVKLVEGEKTRAGFTPLQLEKVAGSK